LFEQDVYYQLISLVRSAKFLGGDGEEWLPQSGKMHDQEMADSTVPSGRVMAGSIIRGIIAESFCYQYLVLDDQDARLSIGTLGPLT
jgi:hypothetical protein